MSLLVGLTLFLSALTSAAPLAAGTALVTPTAMAPSAPQSRPPLLDLAAWLEGHAQIRAALQWEEPDGTPLAYPQWPAAMRARLAALVAGIGRGESPNLPVAPPLLAPNDPSTPFPPLIAELARWSAEVARDTYLAFAAQSLAVEIGHWVPWSMTADPPATLALLLDSRSLFRAEPGTGTYRIPYDFGATTPGDPYRLYEFLRSHDLVGTSERETIERVVGWSGRTLVHFTGDWDAANVYANWQYFGWPPIERILEGTVDAQHPELGLAHRSGACFGTVGVLRLLLRTVNIPVELLHPCPGHGIPHFVRQRLYLSHGDDPYDSLLVATPPIEPAALLIDDAQYARWFGEREVSIAQCKNVGRQVRELAIVHLPNELLQRRCADRASGAAPDRSQVYDVFRFNYSVAQLEQTGLWKRLDEKIAAGGGCAALVRPPR